MIHMADEPGVDGTPAWAYDDDGYCVCCGNGRWKNHMPECELRDALDALRIGKAVEDCILDPLDLRIVSDGHGWLAYTPGDLLARLRAAGKGS